MLGSLDEMVQKYIRAYRSRDDPLNSIIAISIAKVLIASNAEFNVEHIDLDSSSWAKGFIKENGISSKNENNWESRNTGRG